MKLEDQPIKCGKCNTKSNDVFGWAFIFGVNSHLCPKCNELYDQEFKKLNEDFFQKKFPDAEDRVIFEIRNSDK